MPIEDVGDWLSRLRRCLSRFLDRDRRQDDACLSPTEN